MRPSEESLEGGPLRKLRSSCCGFAVTGDARFRIQVKLNEALLEPL